MGLTRRHSARRRSGTCGSAETCRTLAAGSHGGGLEEGRDGNRWFWVEQGEDRNRRGRGVLAILGLAGGLGHQAGTQTASESRAASTSTASSAPTTHRSESLSAATAPSPTTSSTPVAP